ncbi:MAG: flagellin FliC [Xanthomonadaceae bacterium]|nr:flagellin FliC [Xanthomonadaceae bacterium]
MGLRINTNVAAMSARRALSHTSEDLKTSYSRLSSGNRITSAGDDAAGLSISENLRAQVRSMKQAERNANDGISFVQVAEGGMGEIGNILVRLRELSIQAASDTVGDTERGFINQEFQSLLQEVDRIANVTTFGGTSLLNGEAGHDLEFQVGIRNNEADRILFKVSENDLRSDSLGVSGISSETIDSARSALDNIDQGMAKVSEARAKMGAMQNKMHSTVNNLLIARENLDQARSRIADADIAEESSELVRNNILQQAGVAVLAQANQAPFSALKLVA